MNIVLMQKYNGQLNFKKIVGFRQILGFWVIWTLNFCFFNNNYTNVRHLLYKFEI